MFEASVFTISLAFSIGGAKSVAFASRSLLSLNASSSAVVQLMGCLSFFFLLAKCLLSGARTVAAFSMKR